MKHPYLQILEEITQSLELYPSLSICLQAIPLCETKFGISESCQMANWIESKFSSWEHFSGSFAYPVPSNIPNQSPREAYFLAKGSGKMWDKTTEYGRLRYQLLDYLIQEASKL